MSSSEDRIQGLMATWSQLLIKWTDVVNRLYLAEDYRNFWRMVKFVIMESPKAIKESLLGDIEKVDALLNKVEKEVAKNFTSPYERARELRRRRNKIITSLGCDVWFKFHDILDQRGYKEKKGGIFEE